MLGAGRRGTQVGVGTEVGLGTEVGTGTEVGSATDSRPSDHRTRADLRHPAVALKTVPAYREASFGESTHQQDFELRRLAAETEPVRFFRSRSTG